MHRDGVEDLTGGLSNTIVCSDILSRDRFWTEGLMKVNKEFLFGCGSQEWDDPTDTGRDGIIGGRRLLISVTSSELLTMLSLRCLLDSTCR